MTNFDKLSKKVHDCVMALLQAIAEKENAMRDEYVQEGFDLGVAHVTEQINRLSNKTEETPTSTDLTQYEIIALEKVKEIINTGGLRTSDIVEKAIKLPFNPALTERTTIALINRLERQSKVEQKTGRWYSTDIKKKAPDYQVMTYLPDGSKYLGSDITR